MLNWTTVLPYYNDFLSAMISTNIIDYRILLRKESSFF